MPGLFAGDPDIDVIAPAWNVPCKCPQELLQVDIDIKLFLMRVRSMNQVPAIDTLQVPILANPSRRIPSRLIPAQHQPASISGASDQGGLQACARIWNRVRGLDATFWLGLPTSDPDCAPGPDMAGAPGFGSAPYARIAIEAERTLSIGVSAVSAPALLLLAAVALDRWCGAAPAVQLGRTACRLAAHTCQAGVVRGLYAMLIAPRAGELHHGVSTLAALCEEAPSNQQAAIGLAGSAFAAGMSLTELVRRLELSLEQPAADETALAAARELAGRTRLLRGLLQVQASVPAQATGHCAAQEDRFGYWMTQLQVTWYAGNATLAQRAAMRAAPLANAITPVADLACYHLFAALATTRAIAALEPLRRHCAALHALAEGFTEAIAMAQLASALIDHRSGDAIASLCGFERAAASATRRQQHWLASLAAEQAALQAADAGLATAAQHYRRQALVSCAAWGAHGRAEALCRAWGETMPAPVAAPTPPDIAAAGGNCMELDATIAHELNQPLAAIALHAAAARKWLRRSQPDVERALASLSLIGTAGRQASDIVRSVHRLVHHQSSEFEQIETDAVLADALLVLEHPLRRHRITLDTVFGLGRCTIQANRAQVQQVATNLVLNAIEALAGAGPRLGRRRIEVSTYRYGKEMVEIVVADNGPGIAPADRSRLFEQLYSTKPGNSGMGLAISLAIARAHGGTLALEDGEPHGTRFRLRLPLRPPVTS